MAFINQTAREDMQDDTFKLIAALVWEGVSQKSGKSVKGLLNIVDNIYDVSHLRVEKKFDSEEHDTFGVWLTQTKKKIYSVNSADSYEKSKQFDEVCELWRTLLGILDQAGLLFKIQENLDEINYK